MTGKQLCDMLGGIDESLIYDALEYKPRKKVLLKALIAAAAVSALIFSTAFALSPSFREFFISVLFPVYDEKSYTAIDNGHMTGSFDEDDVIMTFLDSLEKEENIRIKSEKGYDYTVSEISETKHEVSVSCAEKGISIYLITENIPYEETSGLWQVTAYRIDKS